jgi:hypothetical protein
MNVGALTFEYSGNAWYLRFQTDPAGHALGIGPLRVSRVVVGPDDGALDAVTANWMRDALYDLSDQIACHLLSAVGDPGLFDAAVLFRPVPEGPLAP